MGPAWSLEVSGCLVSSCPTAQATPAPRDTRGGDPWSLSDGGSPWALLTVFSSGFHTCSYSLWNKPRVWVHRWTRITTSYFHCPFLLSSLHPRFWPKSLCVLAAHSQRRGLGTVSLQSTSSQFRQKMGFRARVTRSSCLIHYWEIKIGVGKNSSNLAWHTLQSITKELLIQPALVSWSTNCSLKITQWLNKEEKNTYIHT